MEELSVVGLSQRKESTVHMAVSDLSPVRPAPDVEDLRIAIDTYPFACVLRLRVVQIVCGISALVMGSVAFIEERRESNLGLGIPAGGATVLAAAASIHQWRGRWRGAGMSNKWAACVRAAGPAPIAALWAIACTLHLALLVQSIRTIIHAGTSESSRFSMDDGSESSTDDVSKPSSRDLTVIACIQIILICATLGSVGALLVMEWRAA